MRSLLYIMVLSRLSTLLVIVALVEASGIVASLITDKEMPGVKSGVRDMGGGISVGTDGSLIALPLLPHDAVLERHRRELREAGFQDDSLDDAINMRGQGRGRSRRRLDSGGALPPGQQQVGALYQGYGTHYVDLWVGTPPQRQTVIVDTGE